MSSFDEDSGGSTQSNNIPLPTLLLAEITAKVAGFSHQIVEMILQSMRTPTIQQAKALKKSFERNQNNNIVSKVTTNRKNKISANFLGIQGGIQRPKMPTSSFLHYYHSNKKALSEQWGQNNASKLTKLASISWRELPPEQKRKYNQLSEQSKLRYQKEMEEFRNIQHIQDSQVGLPQQPTKKRDEESIGIDFAANTPALPL